MNIPVFLSAGDNNKVSIIIPVYNTEKYLERCLDSVCNQTLKDIEIICIDDASTDKSYEILSKYACNDKRIRIISFQENKGAGAARNAGIETATGEYIGFVDSDDYVDLDFYEKLYTKAKESDADVVKASLSCLKNGKPDINREAGYDINKLIKKNKAYFYHSFTSAIYDTGFIKSKSITFPNYNLFEDPFFSIYVAIKANKIDVLDTVKYYYVFNNSSLTKTIDEGKMRGAIECIKAILNLMDTNNTDNDFKKIVNAFLLKQVQSYFWNPNISVHTNQEILNLFFKIYDAFDDKHALINECTYQNGEIIKSKILKIAKNNIRRNFADVK